MNEWMKEWILGWGLSGWDRKGDEGSRCRDLDIENEIKVLAAGCNLPITVLHLAVPMNGPM
jgi:hypothetical protein